MTEDRSAPPAGHRWTTPFECHGSVDYCPRCSPRSADRPTAQLDPEPPSRRNLAILAGIAAVIGWFWSDVLAWLDLTYGQGWLLAAAALLALWLARRAYAAARGTSRSAGAGS